MDKGKAKIVWLKPQNQEVIIGYASDRKEVWKAIEAFKMKYGKTGKVRTSDYNRILFRGEGVYEIDFGDYCNFIRVECSKDNIFPILD